MPLGPVEQRPGRFQFLVHRLDLPGHFLDHVKLVLGVLQQVQQEVAVTERFPGYSGCFPGGIGCHNPDISLIPPDYGRAYHGPMTDTPGAAAPQATSAPDAGGAADASDDGQVLEPRGFGWLDAAGVVAGVALIVIVVDILSDGRLISRRLVRRFTPEAAPDPVPEASDDPAG